MNTIHPKKTEYKDVVVVGAGAAGLYFAARIGRHASSATHKLNVLVLEKTSKPGTKLLMSGAGQCNLTHGGDIKEFLDCYGDKGKSIRTLLYRHSNTEVCRFFEELGISLTEREDGKIFPVSMDAHEIRDALLSEAKKYGIEIAAGNALTEICALSPEEDSEGKPRYRLTTSTGRILETDHLVIASGGASYPTTGSDGTIYAVLERDLQIAHIPLMPALVPAYTENYIFSEISGVSIRNASVKIYEPYTSSAKKGKKKDLTVSGDLLFTHKNLSGPVIINNSRYLKPGTIIEVNYLSTLKEEEFLLRLKKEFSGNSRIVEHWIAETYSLPKRFCQLLAGSVSLEGKKLSSLNGKEMATLASLFCRHRMVISGLGSFKEAMVTAGGIGLDSITLKTMESKSHPGLYFIGEVTDVDGDTGGYNLQFAFSSADAAAISISERY